MLFWREPHIAPEHCGESMKFSITIEFFSVAAAVVVVVVVAAEVVVAVVVVVVVVVGSFDLRRASFLMLLNECGFLLIASKMVWAPTTKSMLGMNIFN